MADDIIAREVVKVSPDTKGFKASLDEQVKKAVAGIDAKLSVKLVPDKTGFKASVTKALGEVKSTATFKVRLVADTTGFAASARAQLAKVDNPTLKVKLVADGTSIGGTTKAITASRGALKKADQDAARSVQKLAADEDKAYEKISRAARKSAAEQQRATRQTASVAQQALKDAISPPKLISLGGQGVRPLNLLYAAAAALSPVILEVGASAIQAGTSIAALGSAAVGTGLLIGGLTIAFKGLSNLLALRKTVQAQSAQQDANNTQTQLTNANAVLDAQAAQIKAERDLHEARVQAARDLTDLKQKIADLQNQQKDDSLSVADAQASRTQVYQNYFATALDRRKADQAVADAKQKQSDTTLSLKQTRQDYATAQSKGVGGADAVVNAQDALRQSTERLAEAQRTAAAGVSKVSSAQANLNAQLAKVSPALREMYKFIDTHEGTWQRLQNIIQQGVLPGFTSFLKAVTDPPKNHVQVTTLEFFAQQAADLGAILGKQVAALGAWTRSPLFRKDFGVIQHNNAASLTIFGAAAQKLKNPLLQIATAASPLLTIFSTDFGKLADWIATKVDKAAKSGSLAKWFHDAGVEAQKWIQIGRNISVLLGNIFKTALPGGNSLVDRFETFTAQLATWSGTDSGQKQLKDFFDFFRNLPYGDITKFLAQAAVFVGAVKGLTMLTARPMNLVFAAIATVAASNPGAVAELLNHVNNMLVTTIGFLVAHPTEAATLLGILGAMRVAKSVGVDIKLPVIDSLKKALVSRFSVLEKFTTGGASTATMEVKAAVVNVYGAEINSGGTLGGSLLGGAAGKTKGTKAAVSKAVQEAEGVAESDLLAGAEKGASKSKLAGAGGIAAIIGGLVASVVIDQIFADAKQGSTKKSIGDALSGAVNGAIIGYMVGGPWVAAIGAGIGALVNAAVNHELGQNSGAKPSYLAAFKNSLIRPQQTAEAKAFAKLTSSPGLSGTANDTALAKAFGPLQDYIRARITTVSAGANTVFKAFKDPKQGQQAANVFTASQSQRSRTGLEQILTSYGWTPQKAKQYAEQVYPIAKPTDAAKAALYNFSGILDGTLKNLTDTNAAMQTVTKSAGKDVDILSGKVKDLKTQLDKVDGKYVVTVTDDKNSVKAVFNDLTTAASYQWVLQSGQEPTTSNVNKIKNQILNKNTYADGGEVAGYSPNPRADNIHAMLTAGEYVQPKNVVDHYGVSYMDKLRRKELPRFADGGPVTWNFPVKIPVAAVKSRIAQIVNGGFYGSSTGGTASGSEQVAELAEATARAMGASDKQLLALIEAGLVESGLRNLNYGDRDSVGFLQQRPSQGWGSVAQIMNVAHATRSFMTRAMKADNGKLTAGELAQAVQRSAYPGRYDQRQADAVAVLNRNAPYLSGYNTGGATGNNVAAGIVTGPLFGPWPSSAASVHGHDSGIWRKIINLVPARLNPGRYGTLYNNRRTDNGGWSWHASGRAVDFMGANQDTLAQWFEARKPGVLELIHRSKTADYGVQRGHDHNMGHEYGLHTGHLHVAMAGGGQVPGGYVPYRKYDSGGGLPPGYTLAFNGTGRTETVRTSGQEAALSGPIRLDRRDLRLMASYVAQAASPQLTMDGRKVAETVHSYSYLPAGV